MIEDDKKKAEEKKPEEKKDESKSSGKNFLMLARTLFFAYFFSGLRLSVLSLNPSIIKEEIINFLMLSSLN